MNTLTSQEILELAKEAGISPVSYADPMDILSYKHNYVVSESKTKLCSVPLWTQDQVDKLFEVKSAKLQEKSQGDAIYQAYNRGQWMDISLQSFITHTGITRIVYFHPASEQPQTVASALEKAAKVVSDFAKQCYDSNATMSDLEVVASEIRALIDQPAEPPASQEIGWLIEKNINGVLHYAYCSEIGLLDWTDDNLKAMRFSRKQDADQLTGIMDTADRVAEHIWMG